MALWMRRLGTGTGFACAKLSEVLPRSERSLATVRMTDFLDEEIRNRYRLRCAKLSEVVARSERSLASVRMTKRESASPRVRGDLTPNLFPGNPHPRRRRRSLSCRAGEG
jgi:hypothetical protein